MKILNLKIVGLPAINFNFGKCHRSIGSSHVFGRWVTVDKKIGKCHRKPSNTISRSGVSDSSVIHVVQRAG